MSLLTWPSSLPMPIRARHVPDEARAFRSDLPGSASYKVKTRDYSGTEEVEFLFDATMASTFYTFWKDTLLEGGVAFNCSWPALKQGGLVVRFLTVPVFKHVYNGAYRVTAVVLVRGASLPVQYASDPYFANVTLLLHGDDASPTTFTDSSQYHRAPTSINGTIVNSADTTAFGGRSIQCFTNAASYLEYDYAVAGVNEPLTIECRYKINQQTLIGDGYAEPRGQFLAFYNGATLGFSANGLINSAITHTFTMVNAVALSWSTFGLNSGFDRVNMAFCREAGGVVSLYFNYRYAGAGNYTGALDRLYVGNRNLTTRTAGVSIEEVRVTTGVARYARPALVSIGDRVVPVQSAPFPNQT